METITEQAANLRKAWETDRRWSGVRRDYTAEDVIRLRPSAGGEHSLARRRARRLWELLQSGPAAPVPQQGAPIVADAEAGFGGLPDAFDRMQSMIEAGAAGVLFEDLLSPQENGGHLAGQVLVPTQRHIKTLNAARLGADVLDVPTLVIARTHAHSASLLTSDADEQDHEFLTGERTAQGFYRVQPGRYARVTRALAFAPYADLLWLETPAPSLAEARAFATIIYSQYPDQLLAYSCSPSFDWREHLDDTAIVKFHTELAAMGYRFPFVTSSSAGTQAVAPTPEKPGLTGAAEEAQFALR